MVKLYNAGIGASDMQLYHRRSLYQKTALLPASHADLCAEWLAGQSPSLRRQNDWMQNPKGISPWPQALSAFPKSTWAGRKKRISECRQSTPSLRLPGELKLQRILSAFKPTTSQHEGVELKASSGKTTTKLRLQVILKAAEVSAGMGSQAGAALSPSCGLDPQTDQRPKDSLLTSCFRWLYNGTNW